MSRRSKKKRPQGNRDPHRQENAVCGAGDGLHSERGGVASGLHVAKSGAGISSLSFAVCGFLMIAVILVFGRTVRHDFVNYDDKQYVYDNPNVSHGLTFQGIEWAFTAKHASNWHPLTWLSHMLDCQLYGLSPGWHHLTNVLFHAATAILLFLVLRRMTALIWPSAFVAAVFAIHPLHVESVAWIAERKDVLSGLFFVLTLGAYAGYVRRTFSLPRYLAVMVFFALGLMAKPMLVTLPFVLLLLDYWPLGRMTLSVAENQPDSRIRRLCRFSVLIRLALEKVPLLALAAASCAATLWAQRAAILHNEYVPFIIRLENAAVAYVAYMGQLFYPANLAVLYPYPPHGLPIWKVAGSILVLAMISVAVVALRRRCPYLLVGWLWYLGMLLPVIGLVQVGVQSMADRYTYLPQIGLYVAIAWGAMQLTQSWPYRGWECVIASSLAITILMVCSCRQTSYWYDSEILWKHTLECTTQNYVAHNNLGFHLAQKGRLQEAIKQYEQSLKIKNDFAQAQINYGVALIHANRSVEAIEILQQVLKHMPDSMDAKCNLGAALTLAGRFPEAIEQFHRILRLKPDYPEIYFSLATVQAKVGHSSEAVIAARKGLEFARLQGNAELAGQIETWLKSYRAEHSNGRNTPIPSKSALPPP